MTSDSPKPDTTLAGVDAAAIRLIQETAVEAAGAAGKVQVIGLADQPDGTKTLVDAAGAILPMVMPRPWRRHELRSIGEIHQYLQHWVRIDALKHGAEEDRDCVQPSVWYAESGVWIVLDDRTDSQRRDMVRISLDHSEAFHLLQTVTDQPAWSQRQFVHVLRTVLWDCMPDTGENLLRQIRTVSRIANDGGRSAEQHGRASYGRDIEQAVQSDAGDLPETITLQVRVYRDPALEQRRPVRCALVIDPETVQFQLLPLAGQLDDAVAEEMDAVADLLGSCGCPAFYGVP